jgi:hypothetical protein
MTLLDFTKHITNLPDWLQGSKSLKLILWAGDMKRGDITDVQRLSEYDMYLCGGDCQQLESNVSYINKEHLGSKAIILINIHNDEQMANFCDLFADKFSVIDADYNGNTPIFPIEAYSRLLAPGGRAYNIRGLNGARFPSEELQNALELFAPVLPPDLAVRRRWTAEMIQLAKDNRMGPDIAWTSPDLLHSYYDGVRERQNRFMKHQMERSPLFKNTYEYTADNLEHYWSKLPVRILTVNLETAWNWEGASGEFLDTYRARFISYLRERLSTYPDFAEYVPQIFDSFEEELRVYQLYLSRLEYFTEPLPTGLRSRVGYFMDYRYPEPRREFDIILSK